MALFGLCLWLLDVKAYANAMWIFAGVVLIILIVFTLVPKHVQWFAAITLYFYLFFSFAAVLFFGGILHSSGVVFVGLAGAIASLSFLQPRQYRIIFFVYFLSVILEALLQPYLTPNPKITANINLVLFVLHILVIAGIMFQTLSRYIEQSIDAKQVEADRLRELDILKTRFYTNITHEFRTPLTVILGMADQIAAKPKTHLQSGLQLISRNGYRLLHLVNQMLDLSKLEAGNMPLHMVQADIVLHLRYLTDAFKQLANEKNIQLHFLSDFDEMFMDFDPEKIESLFVNLLSNAIKYSPDGSDIYIQIGLTDEMPAPTPNVFSPFTNHVEPCSIKKLYLKIQDSGSGIPQDQLSHIFERFFQVESGMTRREEGTGIGLSLVKELVKLMGGNLFAKSSPGQGTTFSVYLPVTHAVPISQDGKTAPGSTTPLEHLEREGMVAEKWPLIQNLPHLLVVEDNVDVVLYMRSVLGKEYQIKVAENGAAGIERAVETIPDIIISDVMMPKKDGFELCQTLKSDFRTCHIPIVLLTAKADVLSKISGLEHGADAYIAKPFNTMELRVCLRKLIELREKLKVKFRLMTISPSPVALPINPDEVFMSNLKELLNRKTGDEDFDTNQLAHLLGLSRIQLFRKLKALTGQSASHILRSFRLNKAKELIQSTSLNISEIAFEVGFKDPAYFSRAFVSEFGYAPSTLRTNQ